MTLKNTAARPAATVVTAANASVGTLGNLDMIRVTSALVQTLGGLRIDERARVLRADGAPIKGLYAGGGTAAGLAGDRPEGYLAGVGLLAAFGLGWIAARDVTR